MALPRFFCPIPLNNHTLITLPKEAAHHAGRSLRLRKGSRITLFNGEGGEYQGELQFNDGIAQASIDTFIEDNRCLKGNITLIQALAAGDKMDWIIEKAVELGVSRFIPLAAERSVLQLSGARLEKRQQHWQEIIQSACEQSGRNILMQLLPLQTLKTVFNFTGNTHLFIADPDGKLSLTEHLHQHPTLNNIGFFIGPEGGWSPKEMDIIQKESAVKIQFGSRILRTETAGLALSSASAAILGWI